MKSWPLPSPLSVTSSGMYVSVEEFGLPLSQPRCDDPSAEDQCHSMKGLLFFLNQLILLWDPQIHFLMISSLCFEFSVAQKQFPAEYLSAPIDIVEHWTGLKGLSFLQRPGLALPFPCDSQIRRVQIYLFQIYLLRWPLCFYSVN